MSIDDRARSAGSRTVTIFDESTNVDYSYDRLVARRRTQRRNHMVALVATLTAVVLAVVFVQSNLSADSEPQPMEPPPGLEIGNVPVWYDDAGLHYGDAVDQTAVPLTAAFSLVRTGALYQDQRSKEIWFHPWGGEPRVIGRDSGGWPAYGPGSDPSGDTAAWFEGDELVVYDTVATQELARVRTARVSGPRVAEHVPWSNGFMQVSSDAVVWASDAEPDRVFRLDLQTQEITEIYGPGGSWVERGFSVVQRLEDVHDEIQLWSWGLGRGAGGLTIRVPGSKDLKFPDLEQGIGRISPDGSFLLAVAKDHRTAFVNLDNGDSFPLPEEGKNSYPWISWSYGSTALIILDRGKTGQNVGINDSLIACNPIDRECKQLPSVGHVVRPAS